MINPNLEQIICYEHEAQHYLNQGYFIMFVYTTKAEQGYTDWEVTEESQLVKSNYNSYNGSISYDEKWVPKTRVKKDYTGTVTKFVMARREVIKVLYGAKDGT